MNNNNTPEYIEGADASLKIAREHVHKPLYRRIALLEIVLFIGGALLIDQMFFDGTRFSRIQPHPFWILIVLVSVQYGTRMGLVAVLVSTLTFLPGNIPDVLLEQDLHQWFYTAFKLPLLWLISAIIIGEISMRHINDRIEMNGELADSLKRESTLIDSFHSINAVKERLEVRAAGQWHTLSKALQAVQNVEYREPAMVLDSSLDLIASLLEPKQFSIYMFRDNALHRKLHRGWDKDDNYLSVIDEINPIFTAVVGEKRIMCISNAADESLLDGQGVLAGPLIVPGTGELLGMLKIEKLPFGKLSLNSVKYFKFLSEWIGIIYGKSLEYQLHDNAINANFDQFVKSEYFFDHFKSYLTELANRIGFNVTMLQIQVQDYYILPHEKRSHFKEALEQAVVDVFRHTDLLFVVEVEHGEYAVLLSGSQRHDEISIKDRLRKVLDEQLTSMAEEVDYLLETQFLSHANKFIRRIPKGKTRDKHITMDS